MKPKTINTSISHPDTPANREALYLAMPSDDHLPRGIPCFLVARNGRLVWMSGADMMDAGRVGAFIVAEVSPWKNPTKSWVNKPWGELTFTQGGP